MTTYQYWVSRVETTHHAITRDDGTPVVRIHEVPGHFMPLDNWVNDKVRLGYRVKDSLELPGTYQATFYNPETDTTKQVNFFRTIG